MHSFPANQSCDSCICPADSPRCRAGQKQIYGAAKFEEVLVRCQVEASPADVTFRWSFNNTGEVTNLPTERFT